MVDVGPNLVRAIIISAIGWLLIVVATAIPYWWSNKPFKSSVEINIGLFKICYESGCKEYSDIYGSTPSWAGGSQASMILSILIEFASFPALALYIFYLKDKQALLTFAGVCNYITSGLPSAAVLVVLLQMIIEHPYGAGIPHASFFITLFALGFFGSAGRLIFRAKTPPVLVVSAPATGFTNQTTFAMQPTVPAAGGLVVIQSPAVSNPVLQSPVVPTSAYQAPVLPTSGGVVLGQYSTPKPQAYHQEY